jgi:hypothetical protein
MPILEIISGMGILIIIKVQYAKERADTRIMILGIYDMDEYIRRIDELEKQYGKEKIRKIMEYAGIIYVKYDVEIIKDVIKQVDKYGNRVVGEAFNCVSRMKPDNYKRTYRHVMGIIKKEGRYNLKPWWEYSLGILISDIERLCPSVSRDMIRVILNRLRKDGYITSKGTGRGALWEKCGNKPIKRGNKCGND